MFSQSDCIFAMLIMQEESLQEPSFSWSVTDMHQKACLDSLRASVWEPFGQPKSLLNQSGNLERHQVSNLDFEGCALAGRNWCSTLKPRPPSSIICILEFRARFARAQFSYLDFEGLSLAGKWCATALLWDDDSLSWLYVSPQDWKCEGAQWTPPSMSRRKDSNVHSITTYHRHPSESCCSERREVLHIWGHG